MHFQKLLIGDLADLLPDSGVGESLPPVRLKVLVVERSQVSIEPTGQVDPVGNRGDWHFPHRQLGPQAVPQLLRYLTMYPADCIPVRRCLQRENGHGKALISVVGIAAAERN